jgi:hypothetical protein
MTTRLEARTEIRLRLEDTGGSPLWDDATLNALIDDALLAYGARFPAERSMTVAVGAGATNVAVSPVLVQEQIVRVIDPDGFALPRAVSGQADMASAPGQAWRWWSGSLVLSAPGDGGTWQIDYRGQRTLPASDAAALDVNAGDEEIVVLLAAAAALRRRSIEDVKRGVGRGRAAIAQDAESLERLADERMKARKRRALGGFVG